MCDSNGVHVRVFSKWVLGEFPFLCRPDAHFTADTSTFLPILYLSLAAEMRAKMRVYLLFITYD